MSLYHEAAAILQDTAGQGGSLKSRIYTNPKLQSPSKQLFALVSETLRWSGVLKDIIEASALLTAERKLTPILALLLVHDLLLSKGGISLPVSHPLRSTTQRHKARLSAELTRLRVKRGFPTLEALKADIDRSNGLGPGDGDDGKLPEGGQTTVLLSRPRWIRVNSMRTSVEEQLKTTFAGHQRVDELRDLMDPSNVGQPKLHIDRHVPDLLALSASTNLISSQAYRNGSIILQDKASCFPAVLLDPSSLSGDVIDACAAPGNKTTHIAALLSSPRQVSNTGRTVFAIERDKARAVTLETMIKRAGASECVTIHASQDFLKLKPQDKAWKYVQGLLLDPSCSGSGIVGRDDSVPMLHLPDRDVTVGHQMPSKKRKRSTEPKNEASRVVVEKPTIIPVPEAEPESEVDLSERLLALSTFQLKLLVHALSFPAARRITYSTCSVHVTENEHVVIRALQSDLAQRRGWRILPREDQVASLASWDVRGDQDACRSLMDDDIHASRIAQGCLRCNKDDGRGTMGFFVAALVRDDQATAYSRAGTQAAGNLSETQLDPEAEWNGFSEDESTNGK